MVATHDHDERERAERERSPRRRPAGAPSPLAQGNDGQRREDDEVHVPDDVDEPGHAPPP
jgi:hypothetical protein